MINVVRSIENPVKPTNRTENIVGQGDNKNCGGSSSHSRSLVAFYHRQNTTETNQMGLSRGKGAVFLYYFFANVFVCTKIENQWFRNSCLLLSRRRRKFLHFTFFWINFLFNFEEIPRFFSQDFANILHLRSISRTSIVIWKKTLVR